MRNVAQKGVEGVKKTSLRFTSNALAFFFNKNLG